MKIDETVMSDINRPKDIKPVEYGELPEPKEDRRPQLLIDERTTKLTQPERTLTPQITHQGVSIPAAIPSTQPETQQPMPSSFAPEIIDLQCKVAAIFNRIQEIEIASEKPDDVDNYVKDVVSRGDITASVAKGILSICNSVRNWYKLQYSAGMDKSPDVLINDLYKSDRKSVPLGVAFERTRVTRVYTEYTTPDDGTEPVLQLKIKFDKVKKIDGMDNFIVYDFVETICDIPDIEGVDVDVISSIATVTTSSNITVQPFKQTLKVLSSTPATSLPAIVIPLPPDPFPAGGLLYQVLQRQPAGGGPVWDWVRAH